MRGDRRRHVAERVELLQLTHARDGQQAGDCEFAVLAPRAEHNFPPLDRSAKRALGRVVRRVDAVLMHKCGEVRKVEKEGRRQIPGLVIRRIDVAACEREELLFDRDQLLPREQCAAGLRITPVTDATAGTTGVAA